MLQQAGMPKHQGLERTPTANPWKDLGLLDRATAVREREHLNGQLMTLTTMGPQAPDEEKIREVTSRLQQIEHALAANPN